MLVHVYQHMEHRVQNMYICLQGAGRRVKGRAARQPDGLFPSAGAANSLHTAAISMPIPQAAAAILTRLNTAISTRLTQKP